MQWNFGRVLLLAAWIAVLAGCGSGESGGRGDTDPANLIVNGSFEGPDVPPGISTISVGDWNLSGWTPVNGNGIGIFDNMTASAGVTWQAYEGDQFAELDANANGGISQSINTVPGSSYYICFAYSPRPGCGAGTNTIQFYLNDKSIDNVTAGGDAASMAWMLYCYSFRATGASTTVRFMAAGDSDGFGGFLDDVQVIEKN